MIYNYFENEKEVEDKTIYNKNETYVNDAYKAYLKTINQYPLLTKDEEIELAKRIKKGDKYAREQFINSNLKLVVSIARKYSYLNMDIMDIIQSGNIGLMEAVDRFDYQKGNKFSTYAVNYIIKYIFEASEKSSRTIRLSEGIFSKLNNLNKVKNKLILSLDREPTSLEIANEIGCKKEEVELLLSYNQSPLSLNQERRNKDGETYMLFETIKDEKEDISSLIENEELKDVIRLAVETLPTREKNVISYFFGLETKKYTINEISKKLNLSTRAVIYSKDKGYKLIKTFLINKGYDGHSLNLAG